MFVRSLLVSLLFSRHTFIFAALSLPRIHSWGNSLEEAFEQCAMGMFGYMTDTETVEPLDTVDVESEGEGTQTDNRPYCSLISQIPDHQN